MLMSLTVGIFAVAYGLIASERIPGYIVTGIGAVAVLGIGAIDPVTALTNPHEGIDWSVIALLVGMMLLVGAIRTTGVFEYLAGIAARVGRGNAKVTLVLILLITAVTSAVLPNLTIVMLVAPVAIHLARQLGVNPVPFVLATIIGSNVGGTATLIGDPPNLIIGNRVGIGFVPFFTAMGPVALIALAVAIGFFLVVFRRALVSVSPVVAERAADSDTRELSHLPLLTVSIALLGVVIGAYIAGGLGGFDPAVIALAAGVLAAGLSRTSIRAIVSGIEWRTLVFFAGLFVLVGALVSVGALHAFAGFLAGAVGTNLDVVSVVLLGVSGIVSGIVDNIPYVTSMIPVVTELNTALGLGHDSGLWWVLATGADLGGNLTIVGASANIVGIAIAHREGIRLTMWDYAKVGVPLTLLMLAASIPYLLALG
jgi:Na+/H+ antiporter NhaD/arsenite permease-like protein